MKEIELLAPVGSFDSLKAAVQNGANAVYLGGKDFSARASANNFDREELKEAVKYAMKSAHPDNGGDAKDFMKFRELYNKIK